MQALILAGGEGTRLRPLTSTIPKPVLPLAGRPFLEFMLDWLVRSGVDDVILSCGFMADEVERVLGEIYRGTRLRHVTEESPLGTAGPVRLALDAGMLEEELLVLNGDVLNDIDLSGQLAAHRANAARCTLALIAVEDTSSYGVVPTDSDGRVEAFLEKTAGEVPTDRINAGCYVLEREVVADLVPAGRAVSFEREVFPALVGNGLFGYQASGYWIDIGSPERYLQATWDLLAGVVESDLPVRNESGSLIASSSITSGARIGPQSVIGNHCSVGTGATVERSVLFDRAVVRAEATVRESVIAESAVVGERAHVGPGAVVGAGVAVPAGGVVGPGERLDAHPDPVDPGPSAGEHR